MAYRETIYLDFRNIDNSEVGHSAYKTPILSNGEYQVFELHKSEAADNSGINVKSIGVRFMHVAVRNNGIPYLYDIHSSQVFGGRLSEMECRMDGIPYTTWIRKTS